MKAILTSFLGGLGNERGKLEPSFLMQQNGLIENLKSIWIHNANVLIVCADPGAHEKNDAYRNCLKEAFPMSGLQFSKMTMCDDRNPDAIEDLGSVDVLVLTGGHVPTQNKFMKQLCLKERLEDFRGIVVAWSAGSMNCADPVYAGPEREGEAVDPLFERWLTGLGITNINIFPHYRVLKDDYLDGLRLIEDITFTDSIGHEIIALTDGSYLMVDGEHTTLFGEAFMIKDGKMWQICKDGESISL